LLVQSIGLGGKELVYGLALIVLSLLAIIIGKEYNRKNLYKLGILFLVLALVARLWFFVFIIHFWVFLALIGITLMGTGVYALSKKKD